MQPSRLPHPLILLLAAVVLAAVLTWILPAGSFDRRDDPATGRRVVVAGTYHSVERSPVGPFAAAVSVPRGFVAGADVIGVVLFVGGAWVVVDRLGTLPALVAVLVARFRRRGLWAIPVICTFFAIMGALENMQEEIIPLVPVLLVLGAGLGVDAVVRRGDECGRCDDRQRVRSDQSVSGGNRAQARATSAICRRRPACGDVRCRIGRVDRLDRSLCRAQSCASESVPTRPSPSPTPTLPLKHVLILILALAPMAVYVYGALRLDWGFNELSGAFLVAGILAGLVGGLGVMGTLTAYLEGAQSLLPAALMIGVARSISMVLDDGHVVDTILNALVTALANVPATLSGFLQIAAQALVHVVVPSVSGQAVLTMPLFVPLADLLGMSRQVPVLAYQTGAGLTELVTPTNGALMALLLAAGVPYERWIRFVTGAALLCVAIGVASIAAVAVWSL